MNINQIAATTPGCSPALSHNLQFLSALTSISFLSSEPVRQQMSVWQRHKSGCLPLARSIESKALLQNFNHNNLLSRVFVLAVCYRQNQNTARGCANGKEAGRQTFCRQRTTMPVTAVDLPTPQQPVVWLCAHCYSRVGIQMHLLVADTDTVKMHKSNTAVTAFSDIGRAFENAQQTTSLGAEQKMLGALKSQNQGCFFNSGSDSAGQGRHLTVTACWKNEVLNRPPARGLKHGWNNANHVRWLQAGCTVKRHFVAKLNVSLGSDHQVWAGEKFRLSGVAEIIFNFFKKIPKVFQNAADSLNKGNCNCSDLALKISFLQ
jgi:hypothetical protein